ncbi:Fic family protein [Candidatus Rhabdochlamydia sp. T3358]|uniref:Fic family protein n=1 Tax=Candidatus Rhabdochlamydia sp. T3358 TaxID=2099795 RepID=UPI0010B280AC|nr:Fic family protein [Candidatus Rhabdochlamydia sp. T3358]VHO02607.1 Fic/DOC family protein [Candidatus Rhabdochlamydia sp. T3358]
MKNQNYSKIFDTIIETVKHFPKQASLEDILQALELSVPKRSLQRYLAVLIKQGRLNALGKARSRRYSLRENENKAPTILFSGALVLQDAPSLKSLIPLSSTALSIQLNVRQPIQARRPIGYNREFLNAYRPNETYYLSKNIRDHLFEMGKSQDSKRPAGTYARHILNRLLIDLSWNSSRLEGNTYSLLETERLLELGEAPEGKNSMEAQMILNHKSAIEFMVESAEFMKFNSFTICNLHALLSDNLLHDQRACGRLRSAAIGITKSVYQPLAIPQLVNEYFQQILDTADAIIDPFEQSFFIMVQLPYLQPFLDVNKRVSRLAANIPLIRSNLCPLSFVDVPEQAYISGLLGIYELNRIELLREVFVWAYERSSSLYSATRQELGEPDIFRLCYRNLIITTIGEIIRKCLNKQAAVAAIKQKAIEVVILENRARFIEVIETELMSLHKGNIARFRLKLSEYDEWLKSWV